MLRTVHLPSAPRPSRAIALVSLGAAVAIIGAGTAEAATGGPVTSRAAAVTTHQSRNGNTSSAPARQVPDGWSAVIHAAAGQARGTLPAFDRPLPAPLAGAQAYLPMTPEREANAATIVQQAMAKHMGLRSAVIAVATAMQESTLLNINYGTYDSLGLFQQRPSAGWGTPAQITDPVYASDAFLNALRQYQASNPGWASQPLWQAAQGVQNSGFPYAYAKWEVQAAQIVEGVASHMF